MAKKPELERVHCEFGGLTSHKTSASLAVKVSPAARIPHVLIDALTHSECAVVVTVDVAGADDIEGQAKLVETAEVETAFTADIGGIASTDKARSFGLSIVTEALTPEDHLRLLSVVDRPGTITLEILGPTPERRGRPKAEVAE